MLLKFARYIVNLMLILYTIYSPIKYAGPGNGEMASDTFFMFLWASEANAEDGLPISHGRSKYDRLSEIPLVF